MDDEHDHVIVPYQPIVLIHYILYVHDRDEYVKIYLAIQILHVVDDEGEEEQEVVV